MPNTYEIGGVKFEQLLSFRGYENKWLLEKQREKTQRGYDAYALQEEIQEALGKPLTEATKEELAPYLLRLEELNRADDGNTDALNLMVRSRVDLKESADAGYFYATDSELQALATIEEDVEYLSDRVALLNCDLLALLADRLIDTMLLSDQAKIIEFFNMELEGVDDPSKLPEEWQEAAEPNPKAQESESQTASKPSTAKSKRKPKATTKSKAAASQTPATTATATTA